MKSTLIALAFASASMTAFAGSGNESSPAVRTTPSQVSRAEVQADLRQALARGEVTFGETTYQGAQNTGFGKTRAQVMAETLEAVQMGQLHYSDQPAERRL